MIINGLRNVFRDDASDYEFEQLDESHSLKKTFASLSKLMKDKFEDYLFFILASDNSSINPAS